MSLSKRQLILAVMIARLSTIRTDNGFQTNIGQLIFRGESGQLGPDDPASGIRLVVRPTTVSDQGAAGQTVVLPVEVQAVTKADLADPSGTIEAGIADIKLAMETGSRTFDELLTRELLRGPERPADREPDSLVVGLAVEYRATYFEDWGAP